MARTIQNNEVIVEETPNLNDNNILNELLSTAKHMSDSYSIFLNEASNDILFDKIFKIFTEIQKQQRSAYNLMFKKGWYKVDCEEKFTIKNTAEQFTDYKNQF